MIVMDKINGVWRTVGGRRIFIKDGQDLVTAIRESGKFSNSKNISPTYSVKANIKTSENFQNNIDSQIQGKVVQYTKELSDKYQDVLIQENIIWKTYTRGKDEIANSAYNLNPNYFKNMEESKVFIRNKMNNGDYVKCDDELKYIVAHEVGHNISTGLYNQLNQDKLKTIKDYENWNNKFMKRVEERYKKEISNELDYKVEVSKYATANPKRIELFAECFAEYTCSSNPRPFAKIFGEELEKERKLLK